MKTREIVLAKVGSCLVLIEVKKRKEGGGKCPVCGCKEFRESFWNSSEWIECCNDRCDFEVLKSHVEEIDSTLTSVSKGDCRA